jgi:hypothetical protein
MKSHAFHRDPQARVAAHGPAMQAEVEILLHVGRVQHGNAGRDERMLGLMRDRRGFRRVIVAREHEHAAVLIGARGIRVLEDVAGAIDARSLAVPHAEYAIALRVRPQIELLRAPHRGGREVFVDAGLEHHVVRVQMFLRFPQRLVDPAERRAAIAGDEAGRIQSRALVALFLQHRQTDERLCAADIDAAFFERVLVVERDVGEGKGGSGRR